MNRCYPMAKALAMTLALLATGLHVTSAAPTPAQSPPARTTIGLMPVAKDLTVEFEALVASAARSGGDLVVQPMAGFGPGWGADAQLFWRPPSPPSNARSSAPALTLSLPVPTAGTWQLTLAYTQAPDYGRFNVRIGGREVRDIEGYAGSVVRASRDLGTFELAAGANPMIVTASGKHASSSGFIVGLDRLSGMPAGPAAATGPMRTLASTGGASAESALTVRAARPVAVHANYALPLAGEAELYRLQGDVYRPIDERLDPADGAFGVLYDFSALESPAATGVVWQVSTRPFPEALPLTGDPLKPDGLVRSGLVWERAWSFEVGFGEILTDLGWRAKPERAVRSNRVPSAGQGAGATATQGTTPPLPSSVGMRRKPPESALPGPASSIQAVGPLRPVSGGLSHFFEAGGTAALYLRVLPVKGDPSHPRVVGYPSKTAKITYGKRKPMDNPFAGYQWQAKEIPRLAVSSFSYSPFILDEKWPKGCVPDKGGMDYGTPFDWVADAIDWAAEAYSDIKSFVVDAAATLLPFMPREVLSFALDAAMVAAGVPPSLPNIDQLMEEGAGYLAEQAASQLVGPVGDLATKEMAGQLFGAASSQMAATLTAEALQEAVEDELARRLEKEIAAQGRAARLAAEAQPWTKTCQAREYPPTLRLTIRNLDNKRYSDVAIAITNEAEIYQAKNLEITLDPYESYDLVLPLSPDMWKIGARAKVPPTFAADAFWERYHQEATRFHVSGPDVTNCLEHENGYVQECKRAPAGDPRPLRFATPSFPINNSHAQ